MTVAPGYLLGLQLLLYISKCNKLSVQSGSHDIPPFDIILKPYHTHYIMQLT